MKSKIQISTLTLFAILGMNNFAQAQAVPLIHCRGEVIDYKNDFTNTNEMVSVRAAFGRNPSHLIAEIQSEHTPTVEFKLVPDAEKSYLNVYKGKVVTDLRTAEGETVGNFQFQTNRAGNQLYGTVDLYLEIEGEKARYTSYMECR